MAEPVMTETAMAAVETAVKEWLEQVVLGLNLCPFAHKPYRNGLVRVVIDPAQTEDEALASLVAEVGRLDGTPAIKLDTTLLVFPLLWPDFLDYNDFLDVADACLESLERLDHYQIASFHPHYQFGGTESDDAENLTNRAPFPILHLLREDSVALAVARHGDSASIPEANIARVQALTAPERQQYFPWLVT
ncbi:DUF1415 domain-containing protein [Salinispirillum sp. LH 10-3-1]|uniref:DUF1415 domain-containing protein n=1 Tax=Salinispirillum sp. LH 10-3-1 TaxID=2952525 RepID=A0AB38YJ17_9GAMM